MLTLVEIPSWSHDLNLNYFKLASRVFLFYNKMKSTKATKSPCGIE